MVSNTNPNVRARQVFDPRKALYTCNITSYDKKEAMILRKKIEAAGLLYDFREVTTPKVKKSDTKKPVSNRKVEEFFGRKVTDKYNSVYNETLLNRFHDTVRVDDAYQRSMEAVQDFVTGSDYTHLILDTNRTYPSSLLNDNELTKIYNNFLYFSLKNDLERIDRQVDFHNVLIAEDYNSKSYGRCCILKQYHKLTGLPISLTVLPSMRLGKVYVDEETNRVVGVEYLDSDRDPPILKADEIIYSVNRDYSQSPNSLFYGYSNIEFVYNYVETNVIINAVDLKEINKSEWMPYYIIQVHTQDKKEIARLERNLEQGKRVFTKSQVTINTIENKHDGNFLLQERDSNNRNIIASNRTPQLITGYEEVRHDASVIVMNVFSKTKIISERLKKRKVFEPQYYCDNLKRLINFRLMLYKGQIPKEEIEKDPFVKELVISIINDKKIWSSYQEHFIDEKLALIQQTLIEENISDEMFFNILEQLTKRYDNLKKDIADQKAKTPVYEYDDIFKDKFNELESEDTESKIAKDIGKRLNGESEEQNKELDEEIETEDENDEEIEIPIEEEHIIKNNQWIDKSFPSPYTVEFELDQLEQLSELSPSTYPFKVKMMFKNISLVSDLEKAAFLNQFKNSDIIPKSKVQEEMGWNDLVEKTQIQDQTKFQIKKMILSLQRNLRTRGNIEEQQQPDNTQEQSQNGDTSITGVNTEEQNNNNNNKNNDGLQKRVNRLNIRVPRRQSNINKSSARKV